MFVRTKLCTAMLLLLWASPCEPASICAKLHEAMLLLLWASPYGPASIWGTLIRAKLLLGLLSLGQLSNFSCTHLRTLHVAVVA